MITNKMNFIFTFIFIITLLFGSVNAFSKVSFETSSNEVLNENGFITISHDAGTSSIICNLTTTNYQNISTHTFINSILGSPYALYYHNIGNGYVEFYIQCNDGVTTVDAYETYFIPVKSDSLEYLITFLLMLIVPFLMKPLGLIDRITKNNVYFEFILFTLITIMILLFGTNASAFYNVYLQMIGLTFALLGLAMSFWFIIVQTITNFNKGGG